MMEEYLSPKKEALYEAVAQFLDEGADLGKLTVSEIAARAGIGKGTVYEYFSNKEELISNALFYQINNGGRRILQGLMNIPSVYGKINYLLSCMEDSSEESVSIIRMIHFMTSASIIPKSVCSMMDQNRKGRALPKDIVEHIIEASREEGILDESIHEVYLQTAIIFKVLGYGAYLLAYRKKGDIPLEEIRKLTCDGIYGEIRGRFCQAGEG